MDNLLLAVILISEFENGRYPRSFRLTTGLVKTNLAWSMAAAVGVAELDKPDTPRRIEVSYDSCGT